MSSSTASFDFYLKNPQIWGRLIPKGTESTTHVDAFNEVSNSDEIHSAFNHLVEVDDQYWENKSAEERKAFEGLKENRIISELIILTYFDAIATNISDERLEKIIAYLKTRIPTYLQSAFIRFRDAVKNKIASVRNRDRASAQFMAQQYQSGIHLVGGRHLYGTLKYLQEYCNAELSSGTDNFTTQPTAQ